MDNTREIIDKATELLKERYGEDFSLEEGNEFVFCLNNGVLILALEDGVIKTKIHGDEAFFIDMNFGLFVED